MAASPVDPALAALRREARADPQKAVRQAAVEFERVFLQMLLRSMREATPRFDPLAGDSTRMYEGMLDEAWAAELSKRSIGLAPIIERQLARNVRSAGPQAAAQAIEEAASDKAAAFVRRMAAPAREASRATGLPAAFILGQAGLESGWGAREIRRADGSTTYNLFGIKAGSGWRGAVVEAPTVEYVGGRAERRIERFRAYGSYAEAFADYARLLATSPRYAEALAARGEPERFAQAIARAGYATDPAYGAKLARAIRIAQRLA
jgi:flagellar protein FlgJ